MPLLLEESPRLCTSPATGFLRIALLALRKIANALTEPKIERFPRVSPGAIFDRPSGTKKRLLRPDDRPFGQNSAKWGFCPDCQPTGQNSRRIGYAQRWSCRSIDFQRCTPSRNHARRMSHTTSTITMIVPTKPKPNISPPSGHMGHQGYPCRHDRSDSGCRLIETSHDHGSSKWDP